MNTGTRKPVPAPHPADTLALDPLKTHLTLELAHTKPLTTCRVDPTGQYVFAGAEDLGVYRWNLKTKEKVTLDGHESWVRSIDFSPATPHSTSLGETMVTADWTGFVIWWKTFAEKPVPVKKVQAHQGATRWVRFSPDGTQVATCGNDNLVKLWTSEGKLIREFAGHERHPYAVTFHPNGKTLVSEDLMGNIKVWEISTGKEVRNIKTEMTGYDNKFAADMGGARDMDVHPSGKTFACAGITKVSNSFAGVQDIIFLLVNPDEQDEKKATVRLTNPDSFKGVAWGIRFHPENFILGAAADRSGKGEMWFWKENETKPFHSVKFKSAARGMDLTPDGRQVAIAHADGKLCVYQMTAKLA